MNRNTTSGIEAAANMLAACSDAGEIKNFIVEMLTKSELETLSKRWRILELLIQGKSQRETAKELDASLCNVTRGAKILKNKNSIAAKYLTKEHKNEQE